MTEMLLILRFLNVALGVASMVVTLLVIRGIPALQGRLVAAMKGMAWVWVIFLTACVYLTVDALVRGIPSSARSLAFFVPLVLYTQGALWVLREVNRTWRNL